ncbi:transcriptional regulator [Saccharomonospora xinjiangensis XJ-54]|uniref:Transcriptional regulator n=1 Tax=Saccharomonospora xinjiangensis XJ-54 TaxID=882086 RepID=I0V6H3_9PSEU|nr:transcriptional regulator [Saccharomonospora xinjiangensis XJ-54]
MVGETGEVSTEDKRREPPVTSVSVILLSLARRIEGELNSALAPLELTVSRLGLLGHIAAVPGVSFSDLARMAGTSVQNVHSAVKGLVNAGLVRDNRARAGARSAIEVTPAGRQLLRAAMEAVTTVDERLFGTDADPVQQRIAGAVLSAFAESPQESAD